MARTGNFGRQPRVASNITNTLVAIAREQANTEDTNIMSAWQKGGMVDGVQVTDDMMLAHWRKRLEGIDKNDPLADQYRNAVTQLEYSVAESKMTAQYALKTAPTGGDDMQMAQFYLNWAKRIPKDSEFYRVLQRDAGQFMRSASSKRKVQTDTEREKAYRASMTAMEMQNERPGQMALQAITQIASQHGIIGETPLGNPSDIANRTNLDQMNLGAIDSIIALIGTAMAQEPDVNAATGFTTGTTATTPSVGELYTDEAGNRVTGQSLAAQFKAIDPNFTGKLDIKYLRGLINDQHEGIEKRISLARETGHVTEMMSLEFERAKINELGRQVSAWPVAQDYQKLHSEMQATLNDNSLLPDAKASRIESIRARMGKLANDPAIAEDHRMQEQLKAEAIGKVGVPTLAEDLQGKTTGYTFDMQTNSDIATINSTLELYDTQRDNVEAGTHVYTQGAYQKSDTTGELVFVPQTNGPSVGAATMAQVNNLPGAGKPVPVMVPNGDGGGSTPMYVVPAPIMVAAKHADGTAVSASNSNPAGSFIQYQMNGKTVTLYSIDRAGKTEWTNDPPWSGEKTKTETSNGVMTVTIQQNGMPNVTPEMLLKDTNFGNGFAIVGASQKADGTPIPGELVFRPQEAIYMTDPTRQAAGHDPFTDSFSASLAAIKAMPDGNQLLAQWTGDSRFQTILDQNAHLSAGQVMGVDGLWTGGTGSAEQYQRNIATMQADIGYAKTGQHPLTDPSKTWSRDEIDYRLDRVRSSSYGPPNPNLPGMANGTPLATSTLQKNPESNRMPGLTSVFSLGSNNLQTITGMPYGGIPGIRFGAPLTVPSAPVTLQTPNAATVKPYTANTSPFTMPKTQPTATYTPPATGNKATQPTSTYRAPL